MLRRPWSPAGKRRPWSQHDGGGNASSANAHQRSGSGTRLRASARLFLASRFGSEGTVPKWEQPAFVQPSRST
eukprot:14955602-Alexandrium_andersonii.AAC.1